MTKEKETTNSEEVIQISRKDLNSLIDERVQTGLLQGVKSQKPKRVTERVATLRFYNDKPVVGYGNIREILEDKTGKLVAWMDINLQGLEKPVSVKYLDFLNSHNSVQVLIKKQEAEEVVEIQGQMRSLNPDEAKIVNKNWNPREIDLSVTSYRYTAEVEVLEGPHQGETFKVSTNVLNQ